MSWSTPILCPQVQRLPVIQYHPIVNASDNAPDNALWLPGEISGALEPGLWSWGFWSRQSAHQPPQDTSNYIKMLPWLPWLPWFIWPMIIQYQSISYIDLPWHKCTNGKNSGSWTAVSLFLGRNCSWNALETTQYYCLWPGTRLHGICLKNIQKPQELFLTAI